MHWIQQRCTWLSSPVSCVPRRYVRWVSKKYITGVKTKDLEAVVVCSAWTKSTYIYIVTWVYAYLFICLLIWSHISISGMWILTYITTILPGTYSLKHPKHPSYKAIGGIGREAAIMILRRFYMTENKNGIYELLFCVSLFLPLFFLPFVLHGMLTFFSFSLFCSIICPLMMLAPVPKSKTNRVLKTAISDRKPTSTEGEDVE